jgi:murein DD-endopeptidase MepM/ murein hydrolase activator NlpD
MTWLKPFPDSQITGHYGTMSPFRRANGMQAHSGTDWKARAGTAIPAITSGTIRLIQYSKILGWCVEQTGWDYKKKKTKYVGYAHLFCDTHGAKCGGPSIGCNAPSSKYKVGQKVEAGEKFGLRLGNSGTATTGAHLHATLGNKPKAIFAITAAKQDLYKFIQDQTAFLEKQQANTKAPKVVLPKVKVCRSCKRPL